MTKIQQFLADLPEEKKSLFVPAAKSSRLSSLKKNLKKKLR